MPDLHLHHSPTCAPENAPLNCIGCGRILQIRGTRPHPSERLCGWCVQRLRAESRTTARH